MYASMAAPATARASQEPSANGAMVIGASTSIASQIQGTTFEPRPIDVQTTEADLARVAREAAANGGLPRYERSFNLNAFPEESPTGQQIDERASQIIAAIGLQAAEDGYASNISLHKISVEQAAGLSAKDIVMAGEQSLLDGFAEIRRLGAEAATTPDMLNAGLQTFANNIDTNVKRFDAWLDKSWDMMEWLKGLLKVEKDEEKMRKILDLMRNIAQDWAVVSKEREKQEELRRLVIMLILGVYIPPSLIKKLKAMGLGHIVDQLVHSLLNKGKVTRALIDSLREAGYGFVIEAEAQVFEHHQKQEKELPAEIAAIRRNAELQALKLSASGRSAAVGDAGAGARMSDLDMQRAIHAAHVAAQPRMLAGL